VSSRGPAVVLAQVQTRSRAHLSFPRSVHFVQNASVPHVPACGFIACTQSRPVRSRETDAHLYLVLRQLYTSMELLAYPRGCGETGRGTPDRKCRQAVARSGMPCKLPRCTPALRVIGKQSYEQRLSRILPLSQISRGSEIVGCFAYSLGGSVLHERRRHDASCTRGPVCCCHLVSKDGTRRDGGHAQRSW
jgi:hypothetical protein